MHEPRLDIPRILIAALRGGSGKTLLSIGITAALRQSGKAVASFKKGPDYIDAGWLALAAGRPCFNLDTFMCGDATVCRSFFSRVLLPTGAGEATGAAADVAVIEGNRGLYDGLDADGTTSTASLAKLLAAPVILCLDCTKTTRTMAAVVLGCLHFDPDVMIRGVILNQVAGARHEGILRQSIEQHCGIRVIGAIPKLRSQHFPERHMGLVPTPEHAWAMDAVAAIADVVKDNVNLSDLLDIAASARDFCCPDFPGSGDSKTRPITPRPPATVLPPITPVRSETPISAPPPPMQIPEADESIEFSESIEFMEPLSPVVSSMDMGAADKTTHRILDRQQGVPAPERPGMGVTSCARPRIGVIRDAAFQFYYPENLESLERAGADLVFFSPLTATSLPDIQALYIGGGFPETHAAQLSENAALREEIRVAAAGGLPIYAECGGLMYLGDSLVLDRAYPMTGVLPVVFGFSKKPQGHGYTIARVDRDTPYYPAGTVLRGHEFHYSKVLEWKGEGGDGRAMAFAMERGRGILNRRDGICVKNVLATYTHIHALGMPSWAPSLVRLAGAQVAHGVKP